MNIFFDKSINAKKIQICLFMGYWIINSGLYLIFNNPIINLLNNIILFFLLTFNYISSIYKRILATVAVYIISMATESIIYYIISLFITEQNNINILGNIISRILFYFIIILLTNLKDIKMINNKISFSYIAILVTIFICSIYVSIALAYDKLRNNDISIALGIAGLLIINIFTVYIYDILNKNYKKELEHKLIERQNDFYMKQLEIMQQSLTNIESMKHDMKNHMISINSISDDGVKVREYINKFFKLSKVSEEYSKSGNVIVDSILNYKLYEAMKKEIEVELKIKIPPQLNILPFDISVILGNILDNAIEAASKLKDNKKITIDIYVEKSSLYIHIINTFGGNIIIEDKKYKTTHSDKNNHGFGLLNVNSVLEKYHGGINITNTETLFSVKIILDNAV